VKSVQEIAVMFEVSRNAVYKWIRSGLKHKREKIIGKPLRIIIDPADVYAFHKSQETAHIKTKEG